MRFTETEYSNPVQMDFVPRERRTHIWRVVIAFTITIGLIFMLSFAPRSIGGAQFAGLASMAVVMILCFYVVYRKQQNLDLVMTTEYENMLFAQAVSLGANFALFVRRDGTIIYANDGLRRLFPHFAYAESQALEGIFEQGGVRKTDRERMMAAIYNNQSDRLVFPVKQQNGEEKDYILIMEPLPRPHGIMVIRGREYRDQRSGTQLLPDILRSTSADKLDHLLASTPVSHYVTDAYGRFEYVNPAFEQLLGYTPGEILDSKLAIYHVLYQLKGHPIGEDYSLSDFTGDALMQKKQGTLANVLLNQSVLRDVNGKISGGSGSILPHPTTA